MFVRLGSFPIKPGALAQLRERYYATCVPLVKSAPGNIDAFLLEPVVDGAPLIACTMWQTEQHAREYESSGAAQEVVANVREHFGGPPTLASYRVSRP